jgi:hypothetical protein
MLIDPAQPTDANLLAKFMQHARPGQYAAQATETSPCRLL